MTWKKKSDEWWAARPLVHIEHHWTSGTGWRRVDEWNSFAQRVAWAKEYTRLNDGVTIVTQDGGMKVRVEAGTVERFSDWMRRTHGITEPFPRPLRKAPRIWA